MINSPHRVYSQGVFSRKKIHCYLGYSAKNQFTGDAVMKLMLIGMWIIHIPYTLFLNVREN
jgi:hypothetical protein